MYWAGVAPHSEVVGRSGASNGLIRLSKSAKNQPGDRFVVVGARSRWRRDGPDRNAVLYDAQGQVVSGYVLGDDIGHVLATSTGQVWVGYFDEVDLRQLRLGPA
jgi:hypothetical protein